MAVGETNYYIIAQQVHRDRSLPRFLLLVPALVYEEPADAARTAIEVLVCAPNGKVDAPGVERHGDISDCVCEVPTADAALGQGTGGGEPVKNQRGKRGQVEYAYDAYDAPAHERPW